MTVETLEPIRQSSLKNIFKWNIVLLPPIFSIYLYGHLLFMLCFELYVAWQLSLPDSEITDGPDYLFAAFMMPSFALAYLTPLIWLGILISACIHKPSVASILTVIILGLLIWQQQWSVVIAYH